MNDVLRPVLRDTPAGRAARRSVALGLVAIGAFSLTGCGKANTASAVDPTAVEQSVSLEYVPGADRAPRQVPVQLGRVLFLKLASPVPVDVQVPGYGVSARARPGHPTTLVLSAGKPGRFDVIVAGAAAPLAQLIVHRR